MDRLTERLQSATRALNNLEEALKIEIPSALERDATIKRFELVFEAAWKAIKEYLWVHEGLDLASPKSVIRSCRELGLLSEEQTVMVLRMTDDRNLAVHSYNDALAEEIYSRIREHSILLNFWLKAI